MNISQKKVLITGASRGIGRALVEQALARGAKIVYAGTRNGKIDIADKRVTPLALDVTDPAQVQSAARQVPSLDVLVNNAGIALYEGLEDLDLIAQTMAVNFYGILNVTRAFLPQLKLSKGAIVNNLSLAGLAPLPMVPAYSASKAAALSITQSFRMFLKSQSVSVHAAIIGPTETDMTRGFSIPKNTALSTAKGIFDGLEKGEEDIFPDPASQMAAQGWRNGIAKGLEQQFAAFAPADGAEAA
jgi:NAD(P)-dependent dehydrogenase (short-subunit alcohol dehydrogenase family)